MDNCVHLSFQPFPGFLEIQSVLSFLDHLSLLLKTNMHVITKITVKITKIMSIYNLLLKHVPLSPLDPEKPFGPIGPGIPLDPGAPFSPGGPTI